MRTENTCQSIPYSLSDSGVAALRIRGRALGSYRGFLRYLRLPFPPYDGANERISTAPKHALTHITTPKQSQLCYSTILLSLEIRDSLWIPLNGKLSSRYSTLNAYFHQYLDIVTYFAHLLYIRRTRRSICTSSKSTSSS